MASPFNVFRKNQKVIIVAAGVLCMFVFVIGDVLFQLVPSGPRAGGSDYGFDDVAVRWEGGELTLGEVQGLVTQRNILRNFLQTATMMGMQATGNPPEVRQVMELSGREESPQQSAVHRHLMAEAAREAGVVISDDAINQYLGQLTQGQVSADQLRQIASGLKVNNRRVGMNSIFEALREEMLAATYWHSYASLLGTVTPHQRWEDWLKFNDRVVVESLAVPVGNFTDQVPDPTDQQLRQFYEQYKDREPSSDLVQPFTELPSPEPGFRIPRRVEAHYIEANYENLVAKIAAEISQDEVRQYYEEHKETFVRPQFDFEGQEGPDSEGPQTDETSADAAGDSAEMAGAPDTADAAAPADEAAQSAPRATDGASGTSDGAAEGEESASTPNDGEVEGAAPADEQSSHLFKSASETTHYVAFQQDDPSAEPAEAGDDESAAGSEADADQRDAAREGAPPEPDEPVDGGDASAEETTPAAIPFAGTTGEADGPGPGGTSDGTVQAPQEGEQGVLEGRPPEPEDPAESEQETQVEYLPLEDVEDEIRERIADSRVPERLRQIMPDIYSELTRMYRDYENRRLDAEALEEDLSQVPPPAYDLQQLAEKHGLEAKQTTLLSQLELQKTPLGESRVQETSIPYWMYAFRQQQLYQPVHTGLTVSAFEQALGRFNEYVVVKMDDQPARTPPLDEIRDEVVRAYKRVKARELAMDAAEALVEKAEEAGEPLQQQLAESDQYEVVESDPFSWYTDSQGQLVFRLSKPYGVEHAGPEFMEKVFSLDPGDIAAVWNHDKSVAYVVRVDEHQLSRDALQNMFLQEANRSQVLQKTEMYRWQQLYQSLIADLLADANVVWEIPPDGREQAA